MVEEQEMFGSMINLNEVQDVAKSQLPNIITASLAMGLMSYYGGDNQSRSLRKMATMAGGQLAGSVFVDMMHKSGKIDDPNGKVAMGIEALVAGSFYSVVALRGLRLPNVNNRQFQEAVGGSLAGSVLGPMLDKQLRASKEDA